MDRLDSFEVFETSHIWKVGQGFVVVTRGALKPDGVFAEFFVVVPKLNCSYYRAIVKYPRGSVRVDDTLVDIDFIAAEAQEFGRHAIQVLVDEAYEKIHEPIQYPPTVDLHQSDKVVLIRMWLRNQCHDTMKTMARETRCAALADYLHKVEMLPPVVVSED